MPRVIGIPPCRGAFGTLVYYYMNGRWYVRSRPIISKESIMTKDSRKRHRENMTEFGFASHVGRKTAAKNTHYTLYLNAVVISDHHAHTTDNHHETRPIDPESAVYTATTHSEPLEIAKDDRLPNITLEMRVPPHSNSHSHCSPHSHSNSHSEQAVLISYGLKYTIFQNGQHTTPERGSARSKIIQHDAYMRIIKVERRPSPPSGDGSLLLSADNSRAESRDGSRVESRDSHPPHSLSANGSRAEPRKGRSDPSPHLDSKSLIFIP